MASKLYFANLYLPSGWARNVEVQISDTGELQAISADCDVFGKELITGWAMAGFSNTHSHAFQRIMRGLAEYSTSPADSFWTWRKVMYGIAQRLTPEDLKVIATQLYIEMLQAGYTSVAEFHYLHHQPGGKPYAELSAMSEAIIAAATDAGIGLTHLPTLYMTAGFAGQPLESHQQRFGNTLEQFGRLLESCKNQMSANGQFKLGSAIHSLRAVPPAAISELLAMLNAINSDAPVHIHIAEQEAEVSACLQSRSSRPVEWLLANQPVNHNWCLVHATHLNDGEITGLAKTGATVSLCPTTEANLGDGLFPLPEFLSAGGKIAIGSDSHVSISPIEELRWLEYGQRLQRQQRNISATTQYPHTGEALFNFVQASSANALGRKVGKIEVGYQADIIVLDNELPDLAHKPAELIFDSMIFAGNHNPVGDVFVGGRQVICAGKRSKQDSIKNRFLAIVQRLNY